MKVWFDDPRQLVDEKQFLQFWPNSKQTPEERINAASRFIVYTSALLYVIQDGEGDLRRLADGRVHVPETHSR
jgi:hypothetical protein